MVGADKHSGEDDPRSTELKRYCFGSVCAIKNGVFGSDPEKRCSEDIYFDRPVLSPCVQGDGLVRAFEPAYPV